MAANAASIEERKTRCMQKLFPPLLPLCLLKTSICPEIEYIQDDMTKNPNCKRIVTTNDLEPGPQTATQFPATTLPTHSAFFPHILHKDRSTNLGQLTDTYQVPQTQILAHNQRALTSPSTTAPAGANKPGNGRIAGKMIARKDYAGGLPQMLAPDDISPSPSPSPAASAPRVQRQARARLRREEAPL